MNGFEVLKKIRATEEIKSTPVMIFTVMEDAREIGIGLALGANDYTVKGDSNPKEILDKVEEILNAQVAVGK